MSDRQTITLGLIQHACPPGMSRADNLDKAMRMMRDAVAQGADLIVTQELFTSVYFPQAEDESHFALAEPIPGPTTDALCELAGELGVCISASLFEKRAPGVYHNTSVMIDGSDQGAGEPGVGRIVGKYRKMHIPDDPLFYEKYYFTPGDLGFRVQRLPAATTGMLVCWDQWFPEAARLTAMQGAQVLLYPTAIGWIEAEGEAEHRRQQEAWRTMQRSHAIANGVYVAAVNRVGVEGELRFWGSSFVCDPGGQVIAEASEADEQVLVVECDLSRIESLRVGWPFLRDRRVDAYAGLTQRLLDDAE